MIKSPLLALLLLLFFTKVLIAQDWQFYHGNTQVNDLAFEADTLWVATHDGLQKRLADGEELQHFYTTNSPLRTNSLSSIAVDSDGNKWIGTYDYGLYRLSPQGDWTNYNSTNSGLPHNYISTVEASPDQGVWVGVPYSTTGSVSSYDGNTWTTYILQNSGLPQSGVISIGIDSDSIWVGTESDGVTLFANNTTVFYESIEGVQLDGVNNFVFMTDGFGKHHVWMFAKGGIIRYGPGVPGCQNYTFNDNSGYVDFYAGVVQPGTQILWVAGEDRVVRSSNLGQGWQQFLPPNSASYNFINAALYLQENFFYFGSNLYNQNLLRYDLAQLQVLSTANTSELSAAGVSYIFVDEDNTAWFGCVDGRICRYQNGMWTAYDILLNNESGGWITHMDKINGQLWASTDNGGLAFFNGNTWELLQPIPNAPWQCFIQVPNGDVWAGTYGITFKPGSPDAVNFNPTNSNYPGNYTTDLDFDSNGKLWATSDNGLSMFTGSNWANWNVNNAPIEFSGFSEIEIDQDDKLWLASSKIYRFDGVDDWWTVNLVPALSGNTPRSIALDDSDNLWISTWGDGLGRMKTDNLAVTGFTQHNSPLGTQSVTTARPDHVGGVWIAPNANGRGVFYAPNTWTVGENNPVQTRLEVRIAPNPAQDNIEINIPSASAELSIVNTAGTVLFSQQITASESSVNIRDLPPGLYFVRMTSGGKMFCGKFVKM